MVRADSQAWEERAHGVRSWAREEALPGAAADITEGEHLVLCCGIISI